MSLPKWIMFSIALLSLTAGCKNHSDNTAPKENTAAHTLDAPVTSIIGTWCGMFEPIGNSKVLDKSTGDSIRVSPTKITLFIDHLDHGKIFGHSVCAGNDRPFEGDYTEEDGKITTKLKEPGDGKYDGVFEVVILRIPLSLSGKWIPQNPAQASREYTLSRKNFEYDTTAGEFSEGSTRLLTSDDVNNRFKDELRLMRNEIYARHGYSFKLKDVRELFDDKDWYMPISTDVRMKLTSIETKNEKLIKQFEKYAEDSYDDYGR